MGWLRFLEAGKKFDCINGPNTVRKEEGSYEFHGMMTSLSKLKPSIWCTCRPTLSLCMLKKSKVSTWSTGEFINFLLKLISTTFKLNPQLSV